MARVGFVMQLKPGNEISTELWSRALKPENRLVQVADKDEITQ